MTLIEQIKTKLKDIPGISNSEDQVYIYPDSQQLFSLTYKENAFVVKAHLSQGKQMWLNVECATAEYHTYVGDELHKLKKSAPHKSGGSVIGDLVVEI